MDMSQDTARWGRDQVVAGIDRTAEALTERVDRLYHRLDAVQSHWEERWRQGVERLQERPGQVVLGSFLAGIVVGLWLSRD